MSLIRDQISPCLITNRNNLSFNRTRNFRSQILSLIREGFILSLIKDELISSLTRDGLIPSLIRDRIFPSQIRD